MAPYIKTFGADIYTSQIKSLNAKLNHSENMGLLADQYLFIHDERNFCLTFPVTTASQHLLLWGIPRRVGTQFVAGIY